MKTYRRIIFLILVLAVYFPGTSLADDAKAREIMQLLEDRDDGDSMTSDMLMLLIDKNGKERKKYFRNSSKDFGKDTKRIMFIKKPAEIRNTGFLTFDYDDPKKDDDQWLFLPAVGKTKRIASSDKSSSFMGSDMNYSDMTSRDLDDYDFKLLKESKLGGHNTWLIESVPKSNKVMEETGYKKTILAVRQDNYMVVKAKMWTHEGGYTKFMDVKKLEEIDGIWVATENHVVKKLGKKIVHQTLLKQSSVKFNQNLDDDMFTIRRLEKGL